MNRLLIPAALLMLSPLVAVAADEPRGDLAKLQGHWSGKVGPDADMPVTIAIEGHAVKVHLTKPDGDEVDLKGEVEIDETAKPRKTIDWVKFTGPNGDPMPDNPGIYVFEDADTLKVCVAGDDHVRPTEFAPSPGDGRSAPSTIVLKREKDKDKGASCEEPKDKATDAPKGDLGKLQGTWTAKAGPEKNVPIAVTIKGNTVSLKITTPDGMDYTADGEVKVDESAEPHKTIDWSKFTSPAGDPLPENLGIYEFVDARTLRVCSGGPGNERPTEFKAGEGGPPNLLVLTRMAEVK